MAIFDALVEAYEAEGITTSSGLNPTLNQDFFLAPFTWLVRGGESITDGLGIALQEVYFLESLAQARPAERIFVIGNAYGWSTLALALANPGARVVAIDAGFDVNSLAGIEVTNRMAARLGLAVEVIEAVSPRDVASVVGGRLGELDLAFVDGFHADDQLVKDWRAVRPFLAPRAMVVFHDVLFLDLAAGFRQVVAESGWSGTLLHGTTTGMGLLVGERDRALDRVTTAFAGHDEARKVVQAEAEAAAHLSGVAQREAALRGITPPPEIETTTEAEV